MCRPDFPWAEVGLGVLSNEPRWHPQVWRPRCPRWRWGRPGRDQADLDSGSQDVIHSWVMPVLPPLIYTRITSPQFGLFKIIPRGTILTVIFHRAISDAVIHQTPFWQMRHSGTNTGIAYKTQQGSSCYPGGDALRMTRLRKGAIEWVPFCSDSCPFQTCLSGGGPKTPPVNPTVGEGSCPRAELPGNTARHHKQVGLEEGSGSLLPGLHSRLNSQGWISFTVMNAISQTHSWWLKGTSVGVRAFLSDVGCVLVHCGVLSHKSRHGSFPVLLTENFLCPRPRFCILRRER